MASSTAAPVPTNGESSTGNGQAAARREPFKFTEGVQLRARGTLQSNAPRQRLPPVTDPFAKCSGCSIELSGFLTDNPSSTKCVILLCGHVTCPECAYRWKLNSSSRAGTFFNCCVCQQQVVDHILPSRQEAIDRACEEANCRFRDRFPSTLFCNHCRRRMCNPCGQEHHNLYGNHNVVQMSGLQAVQKNKPPGCMSKRHISCKTHNIPLKYRCSCGELQCEKCPLSKDPAMLNGHPVTHHRNLISEPELVLEDKFMNTVGLQTKLRERIATIQKQRDTLAANLNLVSNEVCVQFNQMMLMAVICAKQTLLKIQELGNYHIKQQNHALRMLEQNARRIDVGLELDERSRDPTVLSDNTASDIFRSLSYGMLRPTESNLINLTQPIVDQKLSFEFNYDTQAIMEMMSKWCTEITTNMGSSGDKILLQPAPLADHSFNGTKLANFNMKGTIKLGEVIPRQYAQGDELGHLTDFQQRFQRMDQAVHAARQGTASLAAETANARCAPPPSRQQVEQAKRAAAAKSSAMLSYQPIAPNTRTVPVPIPGQRPQVPVINQNMSRHVVNGTRVPQPSAPVPIRPSLDQHPVASPQRGPMDAQRMQQMRAQQQQVHQSSRPRVPAQPAAPVCSLPSRPFGTTPMGSTPSATATAIVTGPASAVPPIKLLIPRSRLVSSDEEGKSRKSSNGSPASSSTTAARPALVSEVQDELRKEERSPIEMDTDGSHNVCYCCRDDGKQSGAKGCCDGCPRIYHPDCHVPRISMGFEQLPDDWKCTLCQTGRPISEPAEQLDDNACLMMSKVLMACYERHSYVKYFIYAVSEREAPGYRAIITHPMWFARINKRLANTISMWHGDVLGYPEEIIYATVDNFIDDMNQVFKNGSLYNPPSSPVARACMAVWSMYQKATREYLPSYTKGIWIYSSCFKAPKATPQQRKRKAEAGPSTSQAVSASGRPKRSSVTQPKRYDDFIKSEMD